MKYLITIILIVLFFPAFIAITSSLSSETPEVSDFPEILGEYGDFGQDEILDALPHEARDLIEGVQPLELTFTAIMAEIWGLVKTEITAPLRLLVSLVGVIILCAAANTLRDSSGGGGSSAVVAFEMVGVLAGAAIMSASIAETVLRTNQTLTAAGAFTLTFVPILAGIMAMMGQFVSANLFSTAVVIAAQVFSQIMILALMPLSASILGVSIAGAVNPDLKTENLAGSIKTAVLWLLGISVTVFTGLLTIQSLVSGSADSVAMKAVKFTISGGVPFIGGAISDALGVVNGSVAVLRSSTGAFGIIAIVSVCLPPIISTIGFRIALSLASGVSSLFGADRLTSLLKSGENVLSIILAMLVCFMLIMVVSIALMLRIGTGG
ncbi:MAG: stage III sporulation protein AE [Oscillospiraceae bacterium]|nr:stage III sporulation protein AE [Oscillospiraceae bacterium]